jgi:hypothetical protein
MRKKRYTSRDKEILEMEEQTIDDRYGGDVPT